MMYDTNSDCGPFGDMNYGMIAEIPKKEPAHLLQFVFCFHYTSYPKIDSSTI